MMTCSLFLILLTFFILLNSIAVIDEKKVRMAIASLVGSFGGMQGGLSPIKSGESIMPPSAPIVAQEMDFNKLIDSLNIELLNNIKVVSRQDRSILIVNERTLFETDSHQLKPEAAPFLDKLCRLINAGRYPVEIIAHTDNRSADEKGYQSNWELTCLQANQVQKYFIERGGIAPQRVTAYGYADYNNIATNATQESREQNRRIEIVFRYQLPDYVKKIFNARPSGIFTYKRFNFKVF